MALMYHMYAALIAIGQVSFILAFIRLMNDNLKLGKGWYLVVILTIFLYFNDLTIFIK